METLQILTGVVSLLAVALSAFLSWIAYNACDDCLFKWHPILMVLSFTLFFTVAVQVVAYRRQFKSADTRLLCTQTHSALTFIANLSWAAGFWVIWTNKENMKRDHFTSYHGLVGGAAMICVCGAELVALYNLLRKGTLNYVWVSRIHRTLGTAAYNLAVVTIALSLVGAGYFGNGWGVNQLGETGSAALMVGFLILSALLSANVALALPTRKKAE